VVVKDGYAVPTRHVRILEAGHPVPDARGETAARAMLDLLRGLSERDVVFLLISGGGSALAPAPPPQVTLEEQRAGTRRLLGAGAKISEINDVRKHLSLMKCGKLTRTAPPTPSMTHVPI